MIRTTAGRCAARSAVTMTGLGVRIAPTDGNTVISQGSTVFARTDFDPTGTFDIADDLEAWLVANLPNSGTLLNPVVVSLAKTKPGGGQAQYRNEGGASGSLRIANRHDLVFYGGATPGMKGFDGAQFVQKTAGDAVFVVLPDPTANPRGVFRHLSATTTAGNSNMTDSTFDFVARGVVPGDQIELRPSVTRSIWTVRSITAVNVGGDPHTITYSGASIGNWTIDTVIGPRLAWNIIYTPTGAIRTAFTGQDPNTNDTAYTQAIDKLADLSRARSMFQLTKCQRTVFRGIRFTGSYNQAYIGTGGYVPELEAQDCVDWEGLTDCEVDSCWVEKFYGNGLEAQQFTEDDNSLVASIGLWVHDSHFSNFGRQISSLTYGGHYIYEDSYLGESARSGIDCEPTTNRVDPSLRATVDGVFFMNCTIGQHGLGLFSLHEIAYVYAGCNKGATGNTGQIGTSGTAVVDFIRAEFNNDGGPTSTSRWTFAEGESAGGQSIDIHFNDSPTSGPTVRLLVLSGYDNQADYMIGDIVQVAGIKYISRTGNVHTANRGNPPASSPADWANRGAVTNCGNYRSVGNTGGTQQLIDNNPSGGGVYVPFRLPVPAHALRDLAVANLAADEDGYLYADENGVNYLVGG